ncbi:hypothetical protein AB0D11_40495 [Streptomyces monashensis]|uniref:hypothetical protein n=1 Tax=Streptomyces monashensis TaxID=1678012 RepID=UPI0033E74A4E
MAAVSSLPASRGEGTVSGGRRQHDGAVVVAGLQATGQEIGRRWVTPAVGHRKAAPGGGLTQGAQILGGIYRRSAAVIKVDKKVPLPNPSSLKIVSHSLGEVHIILLQANQIEIT